jgi:hypothetical protein
MNNDDNNNSIIISPNKIELPKYNIHYFLNNNNNKYRNYNIQKLNDQQLDLLEIPRGLIEVLQNTGFTIEKILDSEPSEIAENLGIDLYVAEIIYKETKKVINNIDPDLILFKNK